jgi:hypothetical protein
MLPPIKPDSDEDIQQFTTCLEVPLCMLFIDFKKVFESIELDEI